MSKDASKNPQEDSKEPENSPEITSEQSDILDFLKEGQKKTAEVAKRLSCSMKQARKELNFLMDARMIIEVKRSHYRLSAALEPRTEAKNQDTINKLLNLYDKVLDKYSLLIEETLANEKTKLEEKATLLNNFKALASMADPLMKRWYLVHRGYDSNTKQAHEDVKRKTVEQEKEALENAPLENQIVEVAHYDPVMKQVWDNLPEAVQKARTV